jgi:hypothetical protein
MKVLKLWYRMSLMPEVQALSHAGFRWLCGVSMNWSGLNSGAITFTQRRHGKAYGLSHPETFARARDEVIATRLVEMVYPGDRNQPAQYALTLVPYQVSLKAAIATPTVATNLENLATPTVATESKIATPTVATCYAHRSNKNDPLYRIARASEYGKEKSQTDMATVTDSSVHTSSQEGDATEALGQPNGEVTGKPSSVPRVSGSDADQSASAERPASDSRQNGPNLRLVRVH